MSHAAAPAAPTYRARQNPSPRTISPDAIAIACALLLPAAVTAWGASYYFASAGDRVRHPLHALLKPSGDLGQGFGWLGLGLFLFMWLYPIRKKLGAAFALGSVATWMRIHTVVGLSLPLLLAVHAGWRFRGVIGLGYVAMLVVSASGIIGRYLYGRIPRSRAGLELSRDDIAGRRRALVTEISAMLRLDPREVEGALAPLEESPSVSGVAGTFRRLMLDDWRRGRLVGELRRRWKRLAADDRSADARAVARAVALAKEEIRLGQQLRVLEATQRVFRYWHVAHRPVSVTALLAVLIHVGVAIAMGQTWIR
ncbi:MAG TPA: hypothetical protein VFU59_11435 [Candidatus Eisenbacteria bacterium]|nr:hypothetical protein [Candidatus Eisenbacteria bacterium]